MTDSKDVSVLSDSTDAILRRPHMYWPHEDKRGTVSAFITDLPSWVKSAQMSRINSREYSLTFEGPQPPSNVEEFWECLFAGCGPSTPGVGPVVALAFAKRATCSYHCAGWEHTYINGKKGPRVEIPLVPGKVTFQIVF